MNWVELLKPENGGPGDSPGRDQAVLDSLASTAERKARKEAKANAKRKSGRKKR